MTIEAQITEGDVIGALSPIMYLVSDPNNAQPDFRYVFNVFIWTGTTGSRGSAKFIIKKQPRLDGKCTIDVSTLVRSYINDIRPNAVTGHNSAPVYSSENGQVYVQIDVEAEWDGGSVAPVSSGIIRATNGWTLPVEGVNAASTPEFYAMSNASRIYANSSGPVLVSFAVRNAFGSVINTLYIQGATNEVVPWPAYLSNNSTSSFVTFNVGEPPLTIDRAKPYTVQIELEGLNVYEIEVVPLCTRENEFTVAFRNKLGGVETIGMTGRSTERQTTERSEYMSRAIRDDLTADFDGGQHLTFNATSRLVYELNTGLLDELSNETMRQLVNSTAQWIYLDGTWMRAKMTTADVTRRTSENDGPRFQWAISMQLAFDNINSIR